MEKGSLGLYTKNELARLLGVDKTTIYNYTKRGVIKAYRFNGSSRVLYKHSEVLDALKPIEQ